MSHTRDVVTVSVDRTVCSGHGACAVLSDGRITLDEWGYPLPSRIEVDALRAKELVLGCPARAVTSRITSR